MRWRAAHPDAALALTFFAAHVLERLVNSERAGGVVLNVLTGAAMSVPFVWRRSRPMLFVVAIVAAAVASSLVATRVDHLFAAIVTIMVIGFSIVRHQEGRDRWVPLGIAFAALGISEAILGSGEVVFVWLVLAGGAVGGAVLRSRAMLTRELAERTHELEALRALRERDAVLEGRRRIARELHDVIAHTVSVMVIQSGGARRQLGRDPERALAALDLVETTGRDALGELDRLFGLLGDTAGTGLDALPAVVERTRAAGLPVELEVRGEPRPLPPEADLALLRVVQEALTNTLKHGGPGATAHVLLDHRDDGDEVVVRDTGWGADGPCGEGSRRGLVGMRERMEPFGGHVEAGPAPAGGFEVRARLPLGAPQEEVAV